MKRASTNPFKSLRSFIAEDSGTVTVEFVLIFPIFMLFFLMTYESGMISLRNTMLDRGVDLAVRDVRLGSIANPTRENLRNRICERAGIIPDCINQLQVEMLRRDPRNWVGLDPQVPCIDRSEQVQPATTFVNGSNNELLFLRVCARFDPVLPTTGIGKAIVEANDNAAAQGSYAIISTAAFVIEPFQ